MKTNIKFISTCLILLSVLSCSKTKENNGAIEKKESIINDNDRNPSVDISDVSQQQTNRVEKLDLNDFKQYDTLVFNKMLALENINLNLWAYIPSDSGNLFISRYKDKDKTIPASFGLISEDGKELLPPTFEQINNPNLIAKGFLEYMKNGKWGLISTGGRIKIPCIYDVFLPSLNDKYIAVAKKGNQSFFINKNGELEEAKFNTPTVYEVLANDPYELKEENIVPIIAPRDTVKYSQYFGNYKVGDHCYFKPNYLSQIKLLKLDREQINLRGEHNLPSEQFKIETSSMIFLKKWLLEIAKFGWGYGVIRGDYYNEEHLILRDKKYVISDSLLAYFSIEPGAVDIDSDCQGPCHVRVVNDSLIEILRPLGVNEHQYGYFGSLGYTYYSITNDGKFKLKKTNRFFAFTKFVKLDEKFDLDYCRQNNIDNSNTKNKRTFSEIDLMINEIYAEYGYKFKQATFIELFKNARWYKPLYDNVDNKLSDLDKHNISILNKIRAKMKNGK